MINELYDIQNLSIVDLLESESQNLPIEQITYEKEEFDSGGFGSLHEVFSINGKQSTGLVIKLIFDEVAAPHALQTITLLHKKLVRKFNSDHMHLTQHYPQLLGMPFCCFEAKDEINGQNLVGLLMYDLRKLGYEDFGSENFSRVKYYEVDIESKLYYSYQLSSVISLLHELEFIHSDLSENAIWINSKQGNLSIIDYDSGYHFDVQFKPSTLGKIGHWIGGKFKQILSKETKKIKIDHVDRIAEENWKLANAIFELLFSVSPYFFLIDASDKTKKYYLKNNIWPGISENDSTVNTVNLGLLKKVMESLNFLKNNGLEKLINEFSVTFNKGYKSYRYRPKSADWKEILSEICKLLNLKPLVLSFQSNKTFIHSSDDPVVFTWNLKRANYCIFNGKMESNNVVEYFFNDTSTSGIEVHNDFGIVTNTIEITANKIEPEIIDFSASNNFRDSENPVILKWSILNANQIEILDISKDLTQIGSIDVYPESKTSYKLKAIGNFGQVVTQDLEVNVVQPEIVKFDFEINIEKGIDNIDLYWESINGIYAEIIPFIGKIETKGSHSIRIQERTTFELKVKGLFGEVKLNLDAKPFPLPVIQSLFIPTPNFNLGTSFLSNSLSVPGSFVSLDSINIDTSLNFNKIKPEFTMLEDEKNVQILINKTSLFGSLFLEIFNKLKHIQKNNK